MKHLSIEREPNSSDVVTLVDRPGCWVCLNGAVHGGYRLAYVEAPVFADPEGQRVNLCTSHASSHGTGDMKPIETADHVARGWSGVALDLL